MAITAIEAMAALRDARLGSTVFVAYEPGRAPTARAVREARRAAEAGLNLTHFVGKLTGVRLNKKGELYFTILTEERDDERRGTQDAFRSFNPGLGDLRALTVLAGPAD